MKAIEDYEFIRRVDREDEDGEHKEDKESHHEGKECHSL
jgi:hypothetical protein